MLPHVRVSQARTGAALCKCLPAACGTAGELHMFVLWSSHMGGRGRARAGPDHRAPSLEPLIISLSLPLSEYLPVFFLFVCLSACLSVVHPSHHHPPIPLSIPAAAAAPWFTPGCEGFAAGTGRDRRRQRGREGEEKAGRGKRRRKDEGGGRLRSVDSVSLRIRTEPKT